MFQLNVVIKMKLFYTFFYLSIVPCGIYASGEDRNCKDNNLNILKDGKFKLKSNVREDTSNNICPNAKNVNALLSRKKRAIGFPDGSNFLITGSLVKAVLLGIPLGWNVALEADVFYKVPTIAEALKRNPLGLHHRQRREVWAHFEDVLNAYGFNGQPCILRTICEAQQYLAPKDAFLVHDLLKILFSAPDAGGPRDEYTRAHTEIDCKLYANTCHFSLLQLLLSYQRA